MPPLRACYQVPILVEINGKAYRSFSDCGRSYLPRVSLSVSYGHQGIKSSFQFGQLLRRGGHCRDNNLGYLPIERLLSMNL